jgi:D-amino-acid dehydrogenase
VKQEILVLGAGMVGTCTALQLALRGHQVTLVDRRPPGRETSYGNAGIIQCDAVEPYAFPRDWATIVHALFKRGAAINYHFSDLPAFAAPLARYWWNSAPKRHASIASAYAQLSMRSVAEHAQLIEQANANDLVRREGYRFVYREASTLASATHAARASDERFGVPHRVLDSDELAQAEPALRPHLAGAIHWLEPWSVVDPGELVTRYASLFQKSGGHVVSGDATSLEQTATGWRILTSEGHVTANQAVMALGPWSDAMLRTMGYRYPLFVKRGYHLHFQADTAPRLAMLDADRGLVIAPMRQGVRITTGAEFARMQSAATPVQIQRASIFARQLLDLGPPIENQPWMGSRPCTADMLPIIGMAPRHRGLWFNFGHGHQGFTMGPVTGRLIAEMIEGTNTVVDPTPYAPARFNP